MKSLNREVNIIVLESELNQLKIEADEEKRKEKEKDEDTGNPG